MSCEACGRGDCPRCDIWTCGCGHEGVSEALSAAIAPARGEAAPGATDHAKAPQIGAQRSEGKR